VQFSGSGSFGSHDRPLCPECGAAMLLIRRGRHPTFGPSWEQRIFACAKCLHEVERSADIDGKPHAD
jgi:hypothetical protein